MADWQAGGFGLYLHWPFCEAKCPYCDFNSHVSATIDHAVWRNAYLNELRRTAEELPGRIVNTVYFGGGTPSLMSPDLVADLLDEIRTLWPVANDLEVTLEANPSSVERGRFEGYRSGGVNRVSVGVQALNAMDLKRLGRLHSVEDARRAIELAAATFDRMSFDLIYARQDQALTAWKDELSEALAFGTGHLSLYQLTVEPGTAFGDRFERGSLRGLPDEDLAADMYEVTQELCCKAGYAAYEVSNHAKDLQASRHNLIYWRGGDYAGIGPGAHGRITINGTRYATETALAPQAWLDRIAQRGSGEMRRSALTRQALGEEYLMMGLRLSEGISISRYVGLAGKEISDDVLDDLQALDMIDKSGDTIRTTPQGRPVLNAILRSLLA